MPTVLLIDDDPHLRTLLNKVLSRNNFEVSLAKDGIGGLEAARRLCPDLIILDIVMPGMDGFEVAQKVRQDDRCAGVPIMVLTAYATPYGRKAAVDAGVDAFITKPFRVEDVVARAITMVTSPDRSPNAPTVPLKGQARLISVHSLRGGLGCTTLAVNLATILHEMWRKPTLLLDADFSAGQVALALNMRLGLSWSDLFTANITNSVEQALDNQAIVHDTGLHVLTAPREPGDAAHFDAPLVDRCLTLMQQQYEYIVADLAHDFLDNTYEILKDSHKILHLLSPEKVSLRLTRKALNTYASMGIKASAVELILTATRPIYPSSLDHVEKIVGRPLTAYIPYAGQVTRASNDGAPFVDQYPEHALSDRLQDLAYMFSKSAHKQAAPVSLRDLGQLLVAGHNGHKNGFHNPDHNGAGRDLLGPLDLTI